jgi:predicted nicotinamide N-methyase
MVAAMSSDSGQPFERILRDHLRPARPPLCPELETREARALVPLWEAVEAAAGRRSEPPYWAWSWPGSQALARYILDRPRIVGGKRALDLGAGNGIAALAAARAGAASVVANDLDPWAARMTVALSGLNGLPVECLSRDLLEEDPAALPFDVVLAGDMFYAAGTSRRGERWLRRAHASGRTVLIGDGGRAFVPSAGVRAVAIYTVPVPLELEGVSQREARVLCLE